MSNIMEQTSGLAICRSFSIWLSTYYSGGSIVVVDVESSIGRCIGIYEIILSTDNSSSPHAMPLNAVNGVKHFIVSYCLKRPRFNSNGEGVWVTDSPNHSGWPPSNLSAFLQTSSVLFHRMQILRFMRILRLLSCSFPGNFIIFQC